MQGFGSIRNALPRRDMLFMILVLQAAAWVPQERSGDSGEKASGADRIIGWYSFSYPL